MLWIFIINYLLIHRIFRSILLLYVIPCKASTIRVHSFGSCYHCINFLLSQFKNILHRASHPNTTVLCFFLSLFFSLKSNAFFQWKKLSTYWFANRANAIRRITLSCLVLINSPTLKFAFCFRFFCPRQSSRCIFN